MFILDLNFDEPIYTIYQKSIHQVRFTKANLLLHNACSSNVSVDVAFELAGSDKTNDDLLRHDSIKVTNDLQGAIDGTAKWVCIGSHWLTGVSSVKLNLLNGAKRIEDAIEQCSELRFVSFCGDAGRHVQKWRWDGMKHILVPYCSDVHTRGRIYRCLVYDMLHKEVLPVKGNWYDTAGECSKANHIKVFTFNK